MFAPIFRRSEMLFQMKRSGEYDSGPLKRCHAPSLDQHGSFIFLNSVACSVYPYVPWSRVTNFLLDSHQSFHGDFYTHHQCFFLSNMCINHYQSQPHFTGWWFGTFLIFPYILGMSSSQLTIIIFFRGVGLNHQSVHYP